MTVSDAQKNAARKWDQANMTRLACKVTREKAARFKRICEKRGTNPNAVLLAYVNKYIEMYEAQEES